MAAQEIKAEKFQTTVIFDAEKITTGDPFTFAGDGASPDGADFTIEVKTPLAQIGLGVTTLNGGGSFAVFSTSAVQWLDAAGNPISIPSSLFLQRNNGLQLTILSVNRAVVADEQFNMEIAVVYNGRTYTSPDPTIINVAEPPGNALQVSGMDVTQAAVMSAQVS
jgi:hypothetical protein